MYNIKFIKFNSEVGELRQGMELFVRMFAGKMNLNHFFRFEPRETSQ